MARKGKTPTKSKEVPYGMDKIEQYNAEREAVESDEEEDVLSGEDEEVLDLGLSDDEYDFGEEDEGEYEEEEGEGGYEFDEEEYDRKQKKKEMDEEDAELLDLHEDESTRPFKARMEQKDLYGKDKGDDDDDIEEAKEQAKQRYAAMDEEDFDMDITTTLKTNKKSKDQKLREQFDADLDAIDLGKEETISKKLDDSASIQEKIARIKRESPELLSLLSSFKEKLHELHNVIIPILEKVKRKQIPTSEGISFLEAKHQLLLSYCTNASFYLMLKAQGHSVKEHPVIDQLSKIRAMLEKSKPVEKKLSYQIDKLVRSANLGALAGGNEELTEKANPADLEVDSEDEEVAQLGLYKAPKVSEEIMETETFKDNEKLLKERRRKKDAKISQYLQEEYGDRPVESNPNLASADYELTPQEKALEELEELNMRRKEITKADRKKYQKRLENQNDVLAGLGDYNDLAVYDDDLGEKKKDEEFMAAKRMRAHMDAIDARNKSKKRAQSDDVEAVIAPKKARTGQGLLSSDLFDDDENIDSDIEEANERRPRFDEGGVPEAEATLEPGDKRKASKKIEENRGMVRIRNKDIKTPHLRYKRAYNRKLGKMGGAQKMRTQDKQYTGEKRINSKLVRSKTYA